MMGRSFGVFAGAVVLVATAAAAWAQAAPTPAQPEEVGLSSPRLEKIGLVFKQAECGRRVLLHPRRPASVPRC